MFLSGQHIANVMTIVALIFTLLNVFVEGFQESSLFWYYFAVFVLLFPCSFTYERWKKKKIDQVCSAIVSEVLLISSNEELFSTFENINNEQPEITVRVVPEPELFDFRPYHFTIASLVTQSNRSIVLVSGHILTLFHDKDALTFILAHEVAHLQLGHAAHVKNRYPNGISFSRNTYTAKLERQTLRDMEFEADQWAAQVVKALGISLDSVHRSFELVEKALYVPQNENDLNYYPTTQERIERLL
jgi:Zn-dependent protease with chaperone function